MEQVFDLTIWSGFYPKGIGSPTCPSITFLNALNYLGPIQSVVVDVSLLKGH